MGGAANDTLHGHDSCIRARNTRKELQSNMGSHLVQRQFEHCGQSHRSQHQVAATLSACHAFAAAVTIQDAHALSVCRITLVQPHAKGGVTTTQSQHGHQVLGVGHSGQPASIAAASAATIHRSFRSRRAVQYQLPCHDCRYHSLHCTAQGACEVLWTPHVRHHAAVELLPDLRQLRPHLCQPLHGAAHLLRRVLVQFRAVEHVGGGVRDRKPASAWLGEEPGAALHELRQRVA